LTIATAYIFNAYVKRKLVQAGSSLAVTLPVEVVKEFKLKKGAEVEVSVHPRTGAVTIIPGVRYFEDGKLTKRFEKLVEEIVDAYEETFKELAK
jgi:antitoxin component of MazEF toxin-antitoxin module